MSRPAKLDHPAESNLGKSIRSQPTRLVLVIFAALMIIQIAFYLALGTGSTGRGISALLVVVQNSVAIVCAWIAFRRARGIAASFWFLFNITLVILLVPTAVLAYDTLFSQSILSASTWRLLFCLYGAPIMLMVSLPNTHHGERLKWQIVLDFFQVAVVVALIYSTFFFLPVQNMSPSDALLHNLSVSNLHSFFLLVACLIRLQFARGPGSRSLLIRLSIFVLVCAVATVIGDWIDQHHYVTASAWFDLGWDMPCLAASLVAITWRPSVESTAAVGPATFRNVLAANLALVTMLGCIHLLMDRWRAANGSFFTDIAVMASLVAFALRLALTQYQQQQEIAQRQATQTQLTLANHRVSMLLENTREQTQEILQVSELGSLLQVCATQQEAFDLIAERLRSLFPSVSGCIALLSASKNHVEPLVSWGPSPPTYQLFAPDECWALRRGCAHDHLGGSSVMRCPHLVGEGTSVCIPLIANGESIGTLALRDDQPPSPSEDPAALNKAVVRRRQLGITIARDVAIVISNLRLREALRLQAVRDPLTGLYNRRYMQEFLERELQRAVRRRRPVAVLMLDLDHFKRYNDTFGHSAGDKALAAVGETLLRAVREEDVACRYGGEEFTVIMAECTMQQATMRAEEIRRNVKECRIASGDERGAHLTASIGIAVFGETTDRMDLLLKFADDALYQAKRTGRDRVVIARPAATLGDTLPDVPDSHGLTSYEVSK